ncbi:RsiV family protein [Niallia nealsonii]|uniref:DUF3298 domain-containing protein n=1 Tax=Niallia nealsonii TaxID=115979 RepID=A0A2N0YXA0_9BACI|nr:RsiV family protein [Niallia nealsonii]PKG21891.1 hypothetical protein CWS01_20085 [Niallia nealsonii]
MVKKLEELKKNYLEISIPPELNDMTNKVIDKYKRKRRSSVSFASLTAALLLCMATINISAAVAARLLDLPVVGGFVKIITVEEWKEEDKNNSADIKIPGLSGLENKGLQTSLNEKYLVENKTLYKKFAKEMTNRMKDEQSSYFLKNNEEPNGFDKISKSQNFYINKKHQLVISFGEYEVTPGYMGVVELVIPTEVINDILVSNTYIKKRVVFATLFL